MQHIIEQSHTSILIALSDTEVGKVLLPSSAKWVDAITGEEIKLLKEFEGPNFKKETQSLQYANTINDLLPRFIRQDQWTASDGKIHDMIVMERLYILPIHHFDLEIRQHMIADFEAKMKELHDNDFVHGDFCRPTSYYNRNDCAWMYKNIVQTEKRLRLIDTGFSRYFARDNNVENFVKCRYEEQQEIPYFKKYYFEEK